MQSGDKAQNGDNIPLIKSEAKLEKKASVDWTYWIFRHWIMNNSEMSAETKKSAVTAANKQWKCQFQFQFQKRREWMQCKHGWPRRMTKKSRKKAQRRERKMRGK